MSNLSLVQRALKAPTKWVPLPGAQFQFLTCPIYEALMHGTRGGGKTDTLLMSFAQHVGKGYGQHWRGVLFRLTYPQLADVVAKSRRWFSQLFPEAKFNKSEYVWEWPTGEMLFFRYGTTEDDYWNYHGHEYPWLGFEELTNWRDLSFYEAMQSTCRSSYPGMPRMVRSTCNPFGRGHGVVKERFQLGSDGIPSGQVIRIDGQKPRVSIRSTIHENKVLLANDPEYLATLEALTDPNRRKAWLEGDWDIHVGSFFEGVWDAKRHIVQPFHIPDSWKVWKSMDWGFAAPYAILWLAMDPDGCIYVWREMYGAGEKPGEGSREPADVVARKVKKIEEHDERNGLEYRMNLADPAIFSNTGTSNTIGGIFKAHGVKWQEAWNGKGSIANGAQEIMRLLAEDKLKIFSNCKHLLRTLPSIGPDDVDPEKYDSDGEDHCFTADTLVLTNKGLRRIDSIGDALVMNDLGDWVPHENWRIIKRDVPVVRVTFADGHSVVCTEDHKFMTREGLWVEAKDLADSMSYAVHPCKSMSYPQPSKSSTGCAITCAASTSSAKAGGCTVLCGSTSTGQCLMGATSTTRTETEATTSRATWSAWQSLSTLVGTCKSGHTTQLFTRLASKLQRLGTRLLMGMSGTSSTMSESKTGCTRSRSACAKCVVQSSTGWHSPSTVGQTAAPKPSAFAIQVMTVASAGRADVGCITVPQRNNFALANGAIVANCVDALRYGVMRRRRSPEGGHTSDIPDSDVSVDEFGNHHYRA